MNTPLRARGESLNTEVPRSVGQRDDRSRNLCPKALRERVREKEVAEIQRGCSSGEFKKREEEVG